MIVFVMSSESETSLDGSAVEIIRGPSLSLGMTKQGGSIYGKCSKHNDE